MGFLNRTAASAVSTGVIKLAMNSLKSTANNGKDSSVPSMVLSAVTLIIIEMLFQQDFNKLKQIATPNILGVTMTGLLAALFKYGEILQPEFCDVMAGLTIALFLYGLAVVADIFAPAPGQRYNRH